MMSIIFLTNEDDKKYVKTINGTTPDENGNVEIEVNGNSGQNTVQSSWAQNDPTQPDYVKNRTHWTSVENAEILNETLILESFEEGLYISQIESDVTFTAGSQYVVNWGGVEYKCTAYVIADALAGIGNKTLAETAMGVERTENVESDEPFVMYGVGSALVVFATDSGEKSLRVSGDSVVYHKIDPAFLPDDIVYGENGMVPVNKVFPTVKEVFGHRNALIPASNHVESTIDNPRPNKVTLNNLTLETFNAMLARTMVLPSHIMTGNGFLAYVWVAAYEKYIGVRWVESDYYYESGSTDICGAMQCLYEAHVHEDSDNPGTIVSECAKITLVKKAMS